MTSIQREPGVASLLTGANVFGRGVLDALLLRDQERAAASRSADAIDVVGKLVGYAEARRRAADALASDNESVAAASLYREAAAILAFALACQERGERELSDRVDVASSWQAFDEAVSEAQRAAAPEALERFRAELASANVAAIDGLTQEAQAERARDAAEVTAWLARQLDVRSVAQIRTTRALRVIALAFVAVALLVALVVVWRTPTNLARGALVTASSRFPGSPSPEGATNGTVEATYGLHTQLEENATVVIDLGRSRLLGEVRVYNRADGFSNDGAVPVVCELSTDGNAFTEVGRRTTPFVHGEAWSVPVDRREARYVRLRTLQKGYIVISEIEVFAPR